MDQKKGPRKGLGLAEDDLSNTGVGWTEREKDCSQRGWMSCWPINYSKRVIMAGVQESGHNKPFSKKICGNLIIYVYVYIYIKKTVKLFKSFVRKVKHWNIMCALIWIALIYFCYAEMLCCVNLIILIQYWHRCQNQISYIYIIHVKYSSKSI